MSKRVKILAMAMVSVSSAVTMPTLLAQSTDPQPQERIEVNGPPRCQGNWSNIRGTYAYTQIPGMCGYGGSNQSFPESEAGGGSSLPQPTASKCGVDDIAACGSLLNDLASIAKDIPPPCVMPLETRTTYVTRAVASCASEVKNRYGTVGVVTSGVVTVGAFGACGAQLARYNEYWQASADGAAPLCTQ